MRTLIAAMLLLACSVPAFALPPIPGYLQKALDANPAMKEVAASYMANEKKCGMCHIPGADKKAKGHALHELGKSHHKHLDHKTFMALDKEGKKDEALKLFQAAWEKTLLDKAGSGETFGELLKAGKQPDMK